MNNSNRNFDTQTNITPIITPTIPKEKPEVVPHTPNPFTIPKPKIKPETSPAPKA
jgi:hypothetical protein